LIFIKQIVTIREVHGLNRGLEITQDNLHEKNQALEMANMRLEALATTDPLTELPNHRTVMKQLSDDLGHARRSQRPLSVLFFDADRFKRVNDTYGHGAGDAVLCQIGERASSVLRAGDMLGRFGGEEFVIVLPEADVEEARVVAERVRMTVAAEPMATLQVEGGIAMTVSIGIASYPMEGDCEQDLLTLADEAMYVAKRLGRNQVRSVDEALQVGEDVELMALLQQDGQHEAAQREGFGPERLRETYTLRITCSLLSLLERRDKGLSAHGLAVSDLAVAIAQVMDLPPYEVSRIGMAALLHDIGKVAIPDGLLLKIDPLTSQEYALLLEHAELGAQILEASPFLTDLVPAVRHHHERWDGSGSPHKLKGQAIPLAARIIAVAEAYDFMCRDYPYQASRTPEEAMAELRRCANTQFDPAVVQALLKTPGYEQEVRSRLHMVSS